MGVTVLVNIVGVIFAIVGIVLYATDLGSASVTWMCHSTYSDVDYNCIKLAYIVQVSVFIKIKMQIYRQNRKTAV